MTKVLAITGGIGAGKTTLIERLGKAYSIVIGSPATTMKRSLAAVLAKEWGGHGELAQELFLEMMEQKTKDEYRLLLQGFGEYFSNRDGSHWINKTLSEVEDAANRYRWVNGFDVDLIVFDSIRRLEEINGIKREYPNARIIRLAVSHREQVQYLVEHLGRTPDKAKEILSHSSEHWLDNFDGWDTEINTDHHLDDVTFAAAKEYIDGI